MTRDELATAFATKHQEIRDRVNNAREVYDIAMQFAARDFRSIERQADLEWYKFVAEVTYDIAKSVKDETNG